MSLPVEFLLIDALRHLDMFSVPGIGSFFRVYIPAQVQSEKQRILAPREALSFTEEITPGGVRALEQFFSRPGNPAEGKEFVADVLGKEINRVLNANGKFELKGLGTLILGSTGLEARWVDDVHLRIYSNLFGFREVKLPAIAQAPAKPAPAPVPEVKAPAPVIQEKPAVAVPPPPKPQAEKVEPAAPAPAPLSKPEPVVVNTPAPIVVEPAPAAETAIPVAEGASPVKPREEAEKPAHKAALRHEERKTAKRKRFPWMWAMPVLGLVLMAALWFLIPRNQSPETKQEIAVATPPPDAQQESGQEQQAQQEPGQEQMQEQEPEQVTEQKQEPEQGATPEASPAPTPGYYLIVASSRLEADVLREADYWKEQGLITEIIPPDGETEFYRLSVLHSTDRKEVVGKMIELKDETYSWILER